MVARPDGGPGADPPGSWLRPLHLSNGRLCSRIRTRDRFAAARRCMAGLSCSPPRARGEKFPQRLRRARRQHWFSLLLDVCRRHRRPMPQLRTASAVRRSVGSAPQSGALRGRNRCPEGRACLALPALPAWRDKRDRLLAPMRRASGAGNRRAASAYVFQRELCRRMIPGPKEE